MIECAPRETTLKELYIRNSQVKVNEISDNRFYDYANVQIASSGLQANSSIPLAQMWISYDITLLKNISSYNVLLSDQYNLPLNSTSRFIPFNGEIHLLYFPVNQPLVHMSQKVQMDQELLLTHFIFLNLLLAQYKFNL